MRQRPLMFLAPNLIAHCEERAHGWRERQDIGSRSDIGILAWRQMQDDRPVDRSAHGFLSCGLRASGRLLDCAPPFFAGGTPVSFNRGRVERQHDPSSPGLASASKIAHHRTRWPAKYSSSPLSERFAPAAASKDEFGCGSNANIALRRPPAMMTYAYCIVWRRLNPDYIGADKPNSLRKSINERQKSAAPVRRGD
jgi:hypothetical protein